MARGKARELAFRTLFQAERGGMDVLEVWQQVGEDLAASEENEIEEVFGEGFDEETLKFSAELLEAFANHREDIDNKLEDILEGWSFQQMAQTDLNVLRMALAEIEYFKDIPKEVTTEMTIRLAKKYGGEESGRFVNGVLSKILKAAKA